MEYDAYRYGYDAPYSRPRKKTNMFAWTLVILLLVGLALAAWLGSFYIFWQPERPDSYRILKKLHKIEPLKRFELTAAPQGEFLNPQQLFERYSKMTPTELAKADAQLARNYIKNFQQVPGVVPYVVGCFTIMQARELTPADIFMSGMAALAVAEDNGGVLLEHVYPADAQSVPLMKQTLVTGLEMRLERAHDLSALVHVERLADGRLLATAVPLLYGTYTVTKGAGTFRLDPPFDLNLGAGWPLFKEPARLVAERTYNDYRSRNVPRSVALVIPGLTPNATPPPAENALVRVEPALPTAPPRVAAAAPPPIAAPLPKGGRRGKNQKQPPSPPPAVAQNKPPAAAPPAANVQQSIAASSPAASNVAAPPQPVTSGDALASTAGGGMWKTFPPGKMPVGRLIASADLPVIADKGLAGERIYLKGDFVVSFAEGNRAVLRPKTKLTDTVLHLGAGNSARVIVEFPAGYNPPAQGSMVTRDDARPYEITEVRKQADGQLNVFAREIIQ